MLCTKVKQPSVRARFKEQGSAPSLSELATAAGLGDSRAAAALWARCSVVATQVARCWANDSAEAEDLSQEALLRVVESFSALRDPAAVVGWLRVIVQRSVTRGARSVRRGRPLFAGGGDPEMLPSPQPLPDVQVDAMRLLATLDGLPEEERRCLWLRRAEGLHIDEIAKETTLSHSTIRRRLHVAERRLVKRLPR
jgi:RNA polymerase sigma-70 factor, ECF subfamily